MLWIAPSQRPTMWGAGEAMQTTMRSCHMLCSIGHYKETGSGHRVGWRRHGEGGALCASHHWIRSLSGELGSAAIGPWAHAGFWVISSHLHVSLFNFITRVLSFHCQNGYQPNGLKRWHLGRQCSSNLLVLGFCNVSMPFITDKPSAPNSDLADLSFCSLSSHCFSLIAPRMLEDRRWVCRKMGLQISTPHSNLARWTKRTLQLITYFD